MVWRFAEITLLLVTGTLALALIGGASWSGMRKISRAVDEIGRVRLPSVQGLLMVSEAQTAIRSANRWALTWENDYTAQGNFSGLFMCFGRLSIVVLEAGYPIEF